MISEKHFFKQCFLSILKYWLIQIKKLFYPKEMTNIKLRYCKMRDEKRNIGIFKWKQRKVYIRTNGLEELFMSEIATAVMLKRVLNTEVSLKPFFCFTKWISVKRVSYKYLLSGSWRRLLLPFLPTAEGLGAPVRRSHNISGFDVPIWLKIAGFVFISSSDSSSFLSNSVCETACGEEGGREYTAAA